jgi:hypothetical protein
MHRIHEVNEIHTDETYLYMTVDGQFYRVHWTDCSPRLAKATAEQRFDLDVSPSGYGLHWPGVDEDLAITPLLQHAERLAHRISPGGRKVGTMAAAEHSG